MISKTHLKFTTHRRFISCLLAFGLVFQTPVFAAVDLLPEPGTMVPLSPASYPAVLKGMTLHPDDPLKFDFLVDTGHSGLTGEALKDESTRLIKYFLTSLTVPEKNLWVNLSPYEKDRIIPDDFSRTEMGRELLAEDYLLKQITATLIYPEDDLGKKFWDEVYAKAYQIYGTTRIPVSTFNKVWIVPDTATVYREGNTVLVSESRLKVMLEEDYFARDSVLAARGSKNQDTRNETRVTETLPDHRNPISAEIIRQIIIPELEKEVNAGHNFAKLRQIYQSLILASWFKRTLKRSFLGRVYVDQHKTEGIESGDPAMKEKIYQRYLEAFKLGVYNLIKEDYDPATEQMIPRKYFSGGVVLNASSALDETELLEKAKKTIGQLYRTLVSLRRRDIFPSSTQASGDLKRGTQELIREASRFNNNPIIHEPIHVRIRTDDNDQNLIIPRRNEIWVFLSRITAQTVQVQLRDAQDKTYEWGTLEKDTTTDAELDLSWQDRFNMILGPKLFPENFPALFPELREPLDTMKTAASPMAESRRLTEEQITTLEDQLRYLSQQSFEELTERKIMSLVETLRNGTFKLDGELIDVVDSEGKNQIRFNEQPIPMDKAIVHHFDLPHRGVVIILYIPTLKQFVLIRKRTEKGVEHEISAFAEHVISGEDRKTAGVRLAEEEAGITINPEDLIKVADIAPSKGHQIFREIYLLNITDPALLGTFLDRSDSINNQQTSDDEVAEILFVHEKALNLFVGKKGKWTAKAYVVQGIQAVLRAMKASEQKTVPPMDKDAVPAAVSSPLAQIDKHEEDSAPGGIDLNPAHLDLRTEGGDIPFKVPDDLENIDPASINGFVPVIIQMTPVPNLQMILGKKENRDTEALVRSDAFPGRFN